MPETPGKVERVLREFRRLVMAGETEQMTVMAKRWYGVEKRMEASYLALAQEVAEMKALGKPVTAAKLHRMERYRSLLGQSMAETRKYQKWSAEMIAARQKELGALGIKNAQELIRASYLESGSVVANFDLLAVEAIDTMIGYVGNGSPLYDLLFKSYPETVDKLTETLIGAVARGQNPRKTAIEMANAMSGNLQRSLTVARTEQLRTFRSASTQQMKKSGVVQGWLWRSAKQTRTCMACLAMDDGVTVHDLDEELNDHPNGRCFKQPAIIGLKPVQTQSGTDYFAALPEKKQRKMMGADKFEAWKEGEYQFADLAQKRRSAEWGTHVSVASIKELTQ